MTDREKDRKKITEFYESKGLLATDTEQNEIVHNSPTKEVSTTPIDNNEANSLPDHEHLSAGNGGTQGDKETVTGDNNSLEDNPTLVGDIINLESRGNRTEMMKATTDRISPEFCIGAGDTSEGQRKR